MSQELTHEEHVELATECVERIGKASSYLNFAASNANQMGEHDLADELDNLGMIHFDEPPNECPVCGNYVLLSYNGVEVFTEP